MSVATDITIQHWSGSEQAAVVERSARAGVMAPLHRRDEAETYQVIEGEVTFFVDDAVVTAGPGDIVVASPGAQRTFRAESDARLIVLTRVNSIDRYVDFGRAVAPPLPSSTSEWPSADELTTLASIAAANDIELLGPPGALPEVRRRAA
ncbi:MAG: cupin domain-containing protein [Thermoleophilaceae bacterium]